MNGYDAILDRATTSPSERQLAAPITTEQLQ
jgi:hypothetical protein